MTDTRWPRYHPARRPDGLTRQEIADWIDRNPQVEARALLTSTYTITLDELKYLYAVWTYPPTDKLSRDFFAIIRDRIMRRASRPGLEEQIEGLGSNEKHSSPVRGASPALPSSLSGSAGATAGDTPAGPRILSSAPYNVCQDCALQCGANCPDDEGEYDCFGHPWPSCQRWIGGDDETCQRCLAVFPIRGTR